MSLTINAIEVDEVDAGRIVEVHVTGRLQKSDYEAFVPEMERLIKEHGKLRLLFDMIDFHGWSAGALWQDFKFDVKHFKDFERLALVGDKQWEKGMAMFCKPFTLAKVKYFDRSEIEAARAWLAED